MNYRRLFLIIFFGFSFCINAIFAQSRFFVKYKNSVEKNAIQQKVKSQKLLSSNSNALLKQSSATVDYFARGLGNDDENLSRIVKVTYKTNVSLAAFTDMLKDDPDVEYVQAAATYHIDSTVNDSLVAQQWALTKIKAFDAWNITKGADSVLIGIIDTGVDYLHPDLKNKIYINKGETGLDANGNDKRFNGIDDDGDGFIDDYMGWDFVDRQGFPFDSTSGDYLNWDNDPKDENGHGTCVAGIIGAETNNGIGVAGTAPNLKMLIMRAFDAGGNGEEDDVAAAILYAVKMGAKVINMSFGDTMFSYILRDVIRYAYSHNIVLVGSAGNGGSTELNYPSAYPEVISVSNSTSDDYISSSSSYGSTIDLAAPGSDILTTKLKKSSDSYYGYELVSGTSASAPFVSAAAGLILSQKNFSNEEVKQILKSTADDIESAGWDIKSGSGRLNLYRALSVLAPAITKFGYPSQDFSTYADTLNINATIQSPYFVKYELYYGAGLNPTTWTSLLTNQLYQITNQNIYTLNLKSLPDSVYTLRLVLYQNNSATVEERVNFYITRSTPKIQTANLGNLYYGDKSTVLAELVTDQRCITRMYYRRLNDNDFQFITLDGLSTNNQFVKQNHYGFIPKQLVQANTTYEIYLDAENMAGLKSVLKDSSNNYFTVKTDPDFSITTANEMSFSLPKGTLYKNPVNFLSANKNEVLLNQYYSIQDSLFYGLFKLENDKFSKVTSDSLMDNIPRAVGDFNGDGKTDIFATWGRLGSYLTQKQQYAFPLSAIIDTVKDFFPVLAEDIDGDGKIEVVSLNNSSNVISIKGVNDDNSLTLKGTLTDFANTSSSFDYSVGNFVTADCNKDGVKELWCVDNSGNILYYNMKGSGNYTQGGYIATYDSVSSNNIMSVGDYDGDGIDDIAILFNCNSIAPYQYLLIFNMKNNKFNILYDRYFLNPATSKEFVSASFPVAYNSVRFVDVDNDKKDELVVNAFPYSYIIKKDGSDDKVIFYKEGTNNYSVFAGDLNSNGAKEVAFQTGNGIKFYEFSSVSQPSTPFQVDGYSISGSSIYLKWSGDGTKYYIYKGANKDSLKLTDSVATTYYTDNNVLVNKNYYYQIRSYNAQKQYSLSNFSSLYTVYSHVPAVLKSAASSTSKTVAVNFSDRINNTIENLQAFQVSGVGYPASISASSQYSYLLTFNQDFYSGTHKLVLSGLRDYYGSPIKTDSAQFTVDSVKTAKEFFISTFQLIGESAVKVTFNLPVDSVSAYTLSNYSFQPANTVEKVQFGESSSILYLYLDKKKPVGAIGVEYRLKINNLISSTATGNIKINDETGSYAVLTGNSQDLSDVYVYPNPAKASYGKMTFAHLPKKARITIWSLSGEKISELEENDGNGGVEFNLRNSRGDLLSSGIYIYRIVRLDDSDAEVEKKIGKFAVIR
jgi:subtilisin family serine protease